MALGLGAHLYLFTPLGLVFAFGHREVSGAGADVFEVTNDAVMDDGFGGDDGGESEEECCGE